MASWGQKQRTLNVSMTIYCKPLVLPYVKGTTEIVALINSNKQTLKSPSVKIKCILNRPLWKAKVARIKLAVVVA